jgi:PilZ domain
MVADREDASHNSENPAQSITNAERRQHPRYSCEGIAEVFIIGKGLRFKGRIADLSEAGCYIETPHQLERGTHVELTFEVNRMRFRLSGGIRVVHLRAGIGIAFDNMNERRRLFVQDLIEELAREEKSNREKAQETKAD